MEGYQLFEEKNLVTIFSAVNYGGNFENDGENKFLNK